ncbi:MAG TPA: terpene synthase family protein [Chitinophaga sp.]|uniref:terpene synthase family protein n=1 Tax=Chitinophaga sp. TaxID=1869181 RepID=UPI002C27D6F1|nr:terpene synthase family protein [Chitinophaga sp.]HVI45218.1 terpene synthase family protein [Chitinophaga sp.]
MKNLASPQQDFLVNMTYPSHNLTSSYSFTMERITRSWIDAYDCLSPEIQSKAKMANYGVLTADILPNANLDVLIPISRWMLWAFIFDDYYGPFPKPELKEICRKAIAVLRGQEINPGDNSLFKQLAITRNELMEISNQEWIQRFIKSHQYYFQGLLMDTFSYKATPEYPSASKYFSIRDRLIGGSMVCDLLELVGQIFPTELFRHPFIQRLRLLSTRLMIFDNDIFSYQKELAEGESMNLVLVLKFEEKISVKKALSLTLKMRNNAYEELMSFHDKITSFGTYGPLVQDYWHNTLILLEGQLKWYKKISKRYA